MSGLRHRRLLKRAAVFYFCSRFKAMWYHKDVNIFQYSGKIMQRKHIIFKGWVQGVGFRYRARHAADHYGVTGWVRNEPDGSVSMEIQGTQEQIDNVIIAIERGSFVRIENMDVKAIPPVESERRFRTY